MALKTKNQTGTTYKYVPVSERDEKQPFMVTIRPLTSRELAVLEDKLLKIGKDETISFSSGSFNWEVCKKGIVDWDNVTDEKNKPLALKKGIDGLIEDETLNLLPLYMITEIAGVISSISKDPENAETFLK